MDNYHSTVMGGYVNRTKIAQLYADAESLGGQTVTVEAPLDVVPAFARNGKDHGLQGLI